MNWAGAKLVSIVVAGMVGTLGWRADVGPNWKFPRAERLALPCSHPDKPASRSQILARNGKAHPIGCCSTAPALRLVIITTMASRTSIFAASMGGIHFTKIGRAH